MYEKRVAERNNYIYIELVVKNLAEGLKKSDVSSLVYII